LALLIGAVAALTAGPLALATDVKPEPVLDEHLAGNVAQMLARKVTHSWYFSLQDGRFNLATREWVIPITAQLESQAARNFVAHVNESTTLACLEEPPAAGCVAEQDIHQLVDDTRERAAALAMAKQRPAPDLQQLAVVILRDQTKAERSGNPVVPRALYFVSIPSPDTNAVADLSPEGIAELRKDHIDAFPGSAWSQGSTNGSMAMRVSVGLPLRRRDGNYDVPYSYYCGPLCAGWYTVVMSHDQSGWHVVSSVMNSVS
jgi:hypothetical protein